MNQTRLGSLIEALLNTLIGYFLNLGVQLVVYPFFGATFTFGQNIQIGLIFMVVSISRSYVIRRWLNQRLHAAAQHLAQRAAP
jgi:membrane protein implicated in regulation of membrane protease activity